MKRGKMLGLLLVITVLVAAFGVTAYLYNDKSAELNDARVLIAKQDERLKFYEVQLAEAGETIDNLRVRSAQLIAVEKKQRLEAQQSLEQFKIDLAEAQAIAQRKAQANVQQQQAQAQVQATPPKSFKFLKTKDGRTYFSVKVLDINAEGITIMHAEGGGKITYDKLPEELSKRYRASL